MKQAPPPSESVGMHPTRARWTDLPADAPMPLLERRRVMGSQCMISHVILKKGCIVPTHAHANEQMVCVLSGCLRFTLANGTTDLRAGEVLHLPPDAPHAAEALEDTTVLDVFAPPSQMTGIDRR